MVIFSDKMVDFIVDSYTNFVSPLDNLDACRMELANSWK